ncbi:hypothetical protein AM500_11190 [Bacillus sp. FJAT-18017]|uniref:GerAB/ArcD/ProY family transporter n=1 Tax=Bacillus sp. FJAT-18017 TaxID=1705566 RepID=UPI0006B06796|nr:GerAB/ArcD/ProY family transporter [Bacillus sp. FJAT-18017]ALC90284.1 hypothetical protein AM500_11190 [Bacillus sp. FJAT-18017]
MKLSISVLQLSLITANFVFTSTLINMYQMAVDIGGQNTWIVPFIIFPVQVMLIWVIIGKKANWEKYCKVFATVSERKTKWPEKLFAVVFLIFIVFVFIKDLRALIDYMATKLLPTTPLEILTFLTILTLIYIVASGFEVIVRVSSVSFVFLVAVVLSIPFMLLNEIELGNLQPILAMEMLPPMAKSIYIQFGWTAEFVFILFVFLFIHPVKEARKGLISGVALGIALMVILLFTEVAVLGVKLVSISTYPTITLIQQINITDFLDRLDLFLVTLWMPTILAKVALSLYLVNRCLRVIIGKSTNIFLVPLSLIMGILTILLFSNNVEHLNFSFFTWPTLGLALELFLILLFLLIKRQAIRKWKPTENKM